MLTWTTGDRLLVTICAGGFLMWRIATAFLQLFVEPTESWHLSAASICLASPIPFGGVQDATHGA